MNRISQSRPAPARWGVVTLLALFLLAFVAPAGQAAENKVTGGTLTWGVRESFRKYLTGPIAHGTMTPSDSATMDSQKIVTFTSASGTIRDGKASLTYKGKVAFYGHGGELNFSLSDPELTLDPKGTGKLSFSYVSGKKPAKRLVLAEVKSASLTTKGTKASISKATTTLAASGIEVFSYQGHEFYPKGDGLDPLSTEVTLNSPAPPSTPIPSPTPDQPKPSAPKPAPPKPSTGKTPPASASSSLTWGLKASFRNYIAGPIAHGRITISDHASATNGGFRFPQTSTSARPPSGTGQTSYRGSVNFYGHDGVLDLTLRNPRVVVPASGNGQLIVDYSVNGKAKGSVALASLDLARGKKTASGSSVTYQNVPATLTSAGTKPFEWNHHPMYPAGTVLDPVSFTIGANAKISGSTGPSVVTSTVAGSGSGSSANNGISGGTSTPAPLAGLPTTSGQLIWGVRSSFRSYILGPIAHGSITVSGGASGSGGAWSFPQSGAKSSDGGAPYRGSIRFYGHGGVLNLTFADPTVRISGNNATLSMVVNGSRKDMVSLNLGAAGKGNSEGLTTYTSAPATLTSAGSGVFSYQGHAFYPAGAPMDPVTFTVGSAASSASGESSSTQSTMAAGSPDGNSAAAAPSSASATKPVNACTATGSTLAWGFKESFRSYINGSIANGDWTTGGGATYKTPSFMWPKGSGSFDKSGREGTVTYPGHVHFTGHDGMLDTTIANPRVELTPDNKAFLRMDVTSTLMEAAMQGRTERYTKTNIRFVELDRSKITVSKEGQTSVVNASSVGTKLTTEGSAAFPNYVNGTAFDPMSFRITTGAKCVTASAGSGAKSSSAPKVDAKGTSSHDSHNGALPWLGGAGVGALATAAVLGGAWARNNSRNHPSALSDLEDVDA